MEVLRKIWGYITFKKNKNDKNNFNLKMMHGINKISIFMFLIGIVFVIVKQIKK